MYKKENSCGALEAQRVQDAEEPVKEQGEELIRFNVSLAWLNRAEHSLRSKHGALYPCRTDPAGSTRHHTGPVEACKSYTNRDTKRDRSVYDVI